MTWPIGLPLPSVRITVAPASAVPLMTTPQAYYDALAAQRSLAASRQVAELAAQNLEAADAKYRSAAITP